MVHREPDWMKPVDSRILEMLEQTKAAQYGGLWLTGRVIAGNLDMSGNYMNKRLRQLVEEGYVEHRKGGFYRIDDKGTRFVEER